MVEQRTEHRRVDSALPESFQSITIQSGTTSFPCQAVDAGAFGLSLVADKCHQAQVAVRQHVVVNFGTFKVDAELVSRFEPFGPNSFRFGVLLLQENQLIPYRKLLA